MRVLLLFPIVPLAGAVLIATIFQAVNWLRLPIDAAWFWMFGIAVGASVLGALLLSIAKLPQYRAGVFLRPGFRHLPPRRQRLYRISFWLIIPSIVVLLASLLAPRRF